MVETNQIISGDLEIVCNINKVKTLIIKRDYKNLGPFITT